VQDAPAVAATRGLRNLDDWSDNMNLRHVLVSAACALALGGCNTMEGVGTDVARGGQKIQDASHKVRQEWREARDRNDRDYQAARGTCSGLAGADRDACIDRAQQRYSAQMNDARRTYPRSSMRPESEEDRLEDAYDAARDRCEAMRGEAQDRCMADARARYRH
jgi:predicted small secreted protein